eukprot:2866697-Amphidinium_carterae.1
MVSAVGEDCATVCAFFIGQVFLECAVCQAAEVGGALLLVVVCASDDVLAKSLFSDKVTGSEFSLLGRPGRDCSLRVNWTYLHGQGTQRTLLGPK